jgi:DNA mismatch endonuclease, patch repair protein
VTDTVDRATRSRMMSAIRGSNTAPELTVRSYLHRQGLRFRLHVRGLPGRPDIVLPKYRTAVFVHGCFWHRHKGCRFSYTPKTRVSFWARKFKENTTRDKRNAEDLRRGGWRSLVIWECQVNKGNHLSRLVGRIVGGGVGRRQKDRV